MNYPENLTMLRAKNVSTKLGAINQDTAYINEGAIILEQAPVIKNDSILVLLRFITESFWGSVKWDEKTRTVELLVR